MFCRISQILKIIDRNKFKIQDSIFKFRIQFSIFKFIVLQDFFFYLYVLVVARSYDKYSICDRLCENVHSSHLVVIREKYLFKDFKLKLIAFARIRPLLFSRIGFSNLLNKIQFTFEVVPCLISGLFRILLLE